MKLARAQDHVSHANSSRDAALAHIYRAMTTFPEMVAGEGRFCTLLMRAFDGALVSKVGADASYAIGVRASDQTARLGAQGALGIAIKVEDGNSAILYAIVAELLAQLGVGSDEQRQALDPFRLLALRNTMSMETGRVAVSIELKRHDIASIA
jgi:L-asparaginase II